MFQKAERSYSSTSYNNNDKEVNKNRIYITDGNRIPPAPTSNTPTQLFVDEERNEESIQKKGDKSIQAKEAPSKGNSTKLPNDVKSKMESSFGANLSSVNIHTNDNSASNMGALAYTQGENIHFAPGQYNPSSAKGQELIGHELTHTIQQRQGRVKPDTQQNKGNNINTDKSLEKEADDIGALAAQGKMANVSGVGSGILKKEISSDAVTQCYTNVGYDEQSRDGSWNLDDFLRVSDNGLAVTSQSVGSKLLYASPSVVANANSKLKKVDSGVELKLGSETTEGEAPDGSGKKKLNKVTPDMDFSQGKSSGYQTAWKDCGKMARSIMDDNPEGLPYARYKNAKGQEKETDKGTGPKDHRDDILIGLGLGETPEEALKAYNSKTPEQKDAFDKAHGLNHYANPDVGEAYAALNAKNFNFHYGGVVLDTGSDKITLENYDRDITLPGEQSTDWFFQMYGTAKKEQSFHEEWDSFTDDNTFTSRTSKK